MQTLQVTLGLVILAVACSATADPEMPSQHQPVWSTGPFNPHARPKIPSFPGPFGIPKGHRQFRSIVVDRVRRSPQGSVQGTITGQEGQRPSINLDYNQKLINDGKHNLDAYGGVSSHDMKHFQPHAGVNYEYRPNDDFFIRGQGGVQQYPGGHVEPSFGVGVGLRFR